MNFAKVGLPLAALALLSTMFLFSRGQNSDQTIPYAELEEIARDQLILEPYYAGVADDGSEVTFSAHSAAPDADQNSILNVSALQSELRSTGGVQTIIRAGSGMLNSDTQIAELEGLVRLDTSNGYKMETQGMTADLETGRFETHGRLEIRAPYGQVTAGKLVIETPEGSDGQQMVFNEGVRLIYSPQNQE